ncbi:MAG: EAL domain-containing protein [Firmicutes bacterium]|nr:EAL domain-containing protein [Bacillota bacterium]
MKLFPATPGRIFHWIAGPILTLIIILACHSAHFDKTLPLALTLSFMLFSIIYASLNGGIASGLASALLVLAFADNLFPFQYPNSPALPNIWEVLSMLALGFAADFAVRSHFAQKASSAAQRSPAQALFETSAAAIWDCDDQGTVRHVNAQAIRFIGHPDAATQPFIHWLHPQDRVRTVQFLLGSDASSSPNGIESRFICPNGDERIGYILRIEHHQSGHFVVVQDITVERQQAAALEQMAFLDPLTGLSNRHAVQRFWQNHPQKDHIAFVMIDVDHFKRINDGWGHEAGDIVLKMFATRAQNILRPSDFLARMGGDEFGLFIQPIANDHSLKDYLTALREAVEQPVSYNGQTIRVTSSMGYIWVDDASGQSWEHWMLQADTALRAAKDRGRNQILPAETFHAAPSLNLEAELLHAIKHNELELHYQPMLHVQTGALFGMEALIRWPHSRRGLLSPIDFLPLANRSGYLDLIDRFVLQSALQQLQQWQDWWPQDALLSINISSPQLIRSHFLDDIDHFCQECRIDPATILIEIPEKFVRDVPEKGADVTARLCKRHLNFALDDFGSGALSLGDFREFLRPGLRAVKIDRQFIASMENDPVVRVILKSLMDIIAATHSIPIIEGVETREQLSAIAGYNAQSVVQGYGLCRPLNSTDVVQWYQDFSAQLLNTGSLWPNAHPLLPSHALLS